jgi:hypothetical protein
MNPSENSTNQPASREYKTAAGTMGRFDAKTAAQRFLASFDDWKSTRSWPTVFIGIAPVLVLAVVGSVVLFGKFVSQSMLGKYVEAAEEAAPIKEDGTGADDATLAAQNQTEASTDLSDSEQQKALQRDEQTEYAFLLYRRVLKQEEKNKRDA